MHNPRRIIFLYQHRKRIYFLFFLFYAYWNIWPQKYKMMEMKYTLPQQSVLYILCFKFSTLCSFNLHKYVLQAFIRLKLFDYVQLQFIETLMHKRRHMFFKGLFTKTYQFNSKALYLIWKIYSIKFFMYTLACELYEH